MTLITERLAAALSDRYRIERELGAGGMATVYLAEDLKHDRKVAIKVLKPELAAVLGAERFVVEIKTTAAMSHPHILPLFDSGTADGFLFYVMPYIQGETIREKLNRETQFGVDEAVRIAREVADALELRAPARGDPPGHQAGEHPAARRAGDGDGLRDRARGLGGGGWADDGGTPVALDAPPASYVSSISRDGATLWFRVDGGTQSDLWRLPLGSGTAKAEPVLATPANEQVPSPSPDGRWLAYRTNASGRDEAVLAPMSSPVAAVQISTDGGVPLGWSGDGRRLFFRQRDEVWEVGVGPGGLVRSTARRIFTIAPWLSNIEVSLDGEHLYAIRGGMIYSDLIVKQGALR